MVKNKFVLTIATIFGYVSCQSFRLPNTVKPIHYDLSIFTFLNDTANFAYHGIVTITVNVTAPTKSITLHSSGLKITENQLKVINENNKESINFASVNYNTDHDFLIINLQNDLQHDSVYKVKIYFTGNVAEGLFGFYRSSYINERGKKEWMLITHFEPNYARRAFPCFDEPGLKATFSIQIGRHNDYTSASNMQLKQSKLVPDMNLWFWDQYETTPPMSTYLVAFMVSKLRYKSVVKDNITIGAWTKNSTIDQVDYALSVAPRIMKFYIENYFGIDYPLSKLDMVAVPDFYTSAMGNWGLITFQESSLLFKPFETSDSARYTITKTIAHKLAHQWYGNYITMKWWTELWLNEGFSSFVANFGIDRLDDNFDFFLEEYVTVLTKSFRFDALTTSHPLSGTTEVQSDIGKFLDSTTFEKGSMMVHMLETILGEKVFRRGIKRFLKDNKYSNVDQDDLWKTMTSVSAGEEDIPIEQYSIKDIMETWTKQRGYPIITVARVNSPDYMTRVDVSQRPFQKIFDPNNKPKGKWWVPLLYTTEDRIKSKKPSLMEWLNTSSPILITMPITSDKWYLFNLNMTGYYRVNYDVKNWQMLTKALYKKDFDGIPLLNRHLLVIDSLDLAWVGQLSYGITLKLLRYIVAEDEESPWIGFLSGINEIDTIVRKLPSYDLLTKYMKQLFRDVALVPDSRDPDLGITTRWYCKVNPDECNPNSLRIFKLFADESDKIKAYNTDLLPINGREIIYCTAIESGDEREWDYIWRYFLQLMPSNEKLIVAKSLGCAKSEWILQRYMEWSILPERGVSVHDAPIIFNSVASNADGYTIALQFLTDDIAKIIEFHKNTPEYLGSYLKSILEYVTTQDQFKQIQQLINSNKNHFTGSMHIIEQSIDIAKVRLKWIETQHSNFIEALKEITKDNE